MHALLLHSGYKLNLTQGGATYHLDNSEQIPDIQNPGDYYIEARLQPRPHQSFFIGMYMHVAKLRGAWGKKASYVRTCRLDACTVASSPCPSQPFFSCTLKRSGRTWGRGYMHVW